MESIIDEYLKLKQARKKLLSNGDKEGAMLLLKQMKELDIPQEDRVLLSY